MANFLTKNRVLLAKVESTPGTDAVPTVGLNAIRVDNLSPTQELETFEPNEFTGSLDKGSSVPAGGFATFNFEARLRGAGTAGTAPDNGVLFRGCAMSQTLLAADVTGTAQASTSSTIRLKVGDVATNGQYVGMVVELTAGAGYDAANPKNNRRVITASVASTDTLTIYPDWPGVAPSTTTTYAVRKCALYKPISTSLEYLTLYTFDRQATGNARRRKSLQSAGTWSLSLPVRQPGSVNFQFRGNLVAPADVSDPGDATFTDGDSPPWLDAMTYLGGTSVCVNTLNIDYGGQVVAADCPNATYGYEGAQVTERAITGSINPPLELVATRNTFGSWLNSTNEKFWTSYGPAIGQRVSIYIPALSYGGPRDADINGFAHEEIPFSAEGNNTGVYICIW